MRRPNRTKIVATLGPASSSEEVVRELIEAGVAVFRLNCAHNDHKSLQRAVRLIRRVARNLNTGVGILADLQGPKIRVGPMLNAEPIFLKRDSQLVISCEPDVVGQAAAEGEVARIGTGYLDLCKDVKAGERMLLDDGNIELEVESVAGTEITTRVVYGGLLGQFKGINLPGSQVSAPCMTDKDRADLQAAIDLQVDFVALSFVRTAADIEELRGLIARADSDVQVVAKIERPEALTNLMGIMEASDALMVARGDLGVEVGPAAVPAEQKRIIRAAVEARKPVITATQMLESMINHPRPTRAEASDVANAIYDGTSAVMLSAETASGKYPVLVVETMERIIRTAEQDAFASWEFVLRRGAKAKQLSVSKSTVRSAAYAALEADARCVAVFTESGSTALLMAGERTPTLVVAFTPFQRTVQRLALAWGVQAFKVARARTSHEMTVEGERSLLENGLAALGDRVVFVSGHIRQKGLTNLMHLRVLE